MPKSNFTPGRLSAQLLWGASLIILLLLLVLSSDFYLSIKRQYQQQLENLNQSLNRAERNRLIAELDSAERMIEQTYSRASEDLKQRSRQQVRQAISQLEGLYRQYHGLMSKAELQQVMVNTLRDVRFFHGRGYIFIDDLDGLCVLLPTQPQLEGTNLLDNQDDTGKFILRGLINAVSNDQQAGFFSYRWYAPGNQQFMRDKISYVELFEPYNWVVGTGDYIFEFEQDLLPEILNRIRNIRFGNNGYITVVNREGVILVNAARPDLEGVNYRDISDQRVLRGSEQVIELAESGGGFIEYEWFKPGSNQPRRKLSLVRTLYNRDLILIAGIYEEDLNGLLSTQQKQLENLIQDSAAKLFASVALIGFIGLMLTIAYSRWLRIQFDRYQQNINQQQQDLIKNSESLKLRGQVFETALEAIAVLDLNMNILKVNQAFCEMTGYNESEIRGLSVSSLGFEVQDMTFEDHILSSLEELESWQGEGWAKRADGMQFPIRLSLSRFNSEAGSVKNYIAFFRDITLRKEAENKLKRQAETDPLTGLANRRTLMNKLRQEIASIEKYDSASIALMFVDLDHFKEMNDSFGHDGGDTVLIEFANRLSDSLRESDLACRIGGDEFVVLFILSGNEVHKQLKLMADRLLLSLKQPVQIAGVKVDVSCSIGVALYSDKSCSAAEFMNLADKALYQAKEQGRGRVVFYDEKRD